MYLLETYIQKTVCKYDTVEIDCYFSICLHTYRGYPAKRALSAMAWRVRPFWQDTFDMKAYLNFLAQKYLITVEYRYNVV